VTFNCQRRPKQDPPGRLSGDFRIHKLEKIGGGGEGKKKYSTRQCKVCAAHKERSETRNICKFCVVQLHKGPCFEKYHSVTELLNYLYAVSAVWDSEAQSAVSNCK